MENLFDSLEQSTVGAAQAVPVADSENATESKSIFDNAVLLNLELRSFGTSRKLNDNEYQCDASKEKTRASKRLLKSEELRKIGKFDGETRRLISVYTLPSQFKAGLYLLPIAILSRVDDMLRDRIAQRSGLVEEFCSRYQSLKWFDSLPASDGGLGSLYREADYPDVVKVRDSFSMAYSYTEFSAPGRLRSVSQAMYDREKEKAAEVWRNAIDEGQALLRASFASLIDHMADRLKPGDSGKPKIFKNTLIERVVEFLNTFDARNLAGDEELAKLVSQAASMLNGVSPDDLRKNEVIRARVQSTVETIKSSLDSMIVDKPGRKIRLTDSDDWGTL